MHFLDVPFRFTKLPTSANNPSAALHLQTWNSLPPAVATNLIIANVETLSHDDSYSQSLSSDGHEFGGMVPWPSGSAMNYL